ncbi:BON domain-containing protein [Streptomyces avidinii]
MDADGTLLGVVSRADLLKVFLRTDDDLAAEVRREVVERLFPLSRRDITVEVTHGVVTLRGRNRDPHLIPVATRLARAVEGVVGVHSRLEGPASP